MPQSLDTKEGRRVNSMKFGDVLREARERSGEDIMSIARRIRIRPDILERIEASDLDNMPPRGYSRNMINAYARYLGLNPTEVVKMYLDAQYNSQVEHARANIRPTGFDMEPERRHALRRDRDEARQPSSSRSSLRSSQSASASSQVRESSRRLRNEGFDNDYFDDIMPDSARRAIASRPSSSATTRRAGAVHVGSYNAYGQGLSEREAARDMGSTRRLESVGATRRLDSLDARDHRTPHRARRSTMPEEHYGNLYAAPRNLGVQQRGGLRDKLPFVLAGIVILLLVIVIAFLANGLGRGATQPAETQPMNITGLPESSSSSSSSGSSSSETAAKEEPKPVETAPTKTVMEFSIADGESSYYEVWIDGSLVESGTKTGPYKNSFDVTGQFQFVASPPDGVSLTQDGTDVPLEAGSSGVASVTVDFADVLAAWNESHPSSAAASSSAS